MIEPSDYFSNRELAGMAWLVLGLAWATTQRGVRRAMFDVCRAGLSPRLVTVWSLLFFWSCLVWSAVAGIGFRDWSTTKSLILWVGFVGIPLLMSSVGADARGEQVLQSHLKGLLGATLVVSFIAGFGAFAFWIEFAFVPVMFLLVAVSVLAKRMPDGRPASVVSEIGLLVIGGAMVVRSVFNVIAAWQEIDYRYQVVALILPVLLSVLFTPFLYFVLYYAMIETLSVRLAYLVSNPEASGRFALRIAIGLRGRVRSVVRLHELVAQRHLHEEGQLDGLLLEARLGGRHRIG